MHEPPYTKESEPIVFSAVHIFQASKLRISLLISSVYHPELGAS